MTKEKIHNLKNIIRQLNKTKSSIEDCIRNLQYELNKLSGEKESSSEEKND